jgi:hypothetical protein
MIDYMISQTKHLIRNPIILPPIWTRPLPHAHTTFFFLNPFSFFFLPSSYRLRWPYRPLEQ